MRRSGGRPLHPVEPERITTSDGVELGVVRWGQPTSAPPLLLVHGGVTAYQCFDPIVPRLAERREVFAYDRRGRGISGDGDAAIEREAQDVIEVARHVGGGGPVDVLGYSYGGMLSLHAMGDEAAPFRRVVAYEPPFGGTSIPPDGVDAEVTGLVAGGDVEGALRVFLRETFLLPDPVVSAMERHPMWQVSLDTAPTIPREFEALRGTRVSDIRGDVPVLVLVQAEGAGGNPGFRDVAAGLAASLPKAEVAYVSGIPHFAIATDVDTFVGHVERFLGTD